MPDYNDCVQQVKFIVSTKVELVNDKINEFLKECYENKADVISIQPIMSYTSVGKTNDRMQGAMMIGAMITFMVPVYDKAPVDDEDTKGNGVWVWRPGYSEFVPDDSRNEQTP